MAFCHLQAACGVFCSLCHKTTSHKIPPMGTFTIKVNGYEVSASSAADAAALVRELSKGGKSSENPPPTPPAAEKNFDKNPRGAPSVIVVGNREDLDHLDQLKPDHARMTLEFLRAIREGG